MSKDTNGDTVCAPSEDKTKILAVNFIDAVLKQNNGNLRIGLIGGQGVGKSTFCKSSIESIEGITKTEEKAIIQSYVTQDGITIDHYDARAVSGMIDIGGSNLFPEYHDSKTPKIHFAENAEFDQNDDFDFMLHFNTKSKSEDRVITFEYKGDNAKKIHEDFIDNYIRSFMAANI